MAIKISGTTVITDSRELDLRNGAIGFGSITAENLLSSSTPKSVGDTIFVTDKNTLATWNGSAWINQEGRVVSAGADGSGGNYVVEPGNGYKYHTFTAPGTFSNSSAGEVDILVVGGGGGSTIATDSRNGGGGGGGIAYWPNVTLNAGSYPIAVGAGGIGNGNGADSYFAPGNPTYSLVGKGGGAAGGGPRGNQTQGSDGGSGGGGSGFDQNTNSGSSNQGSQNPGRSGVINYGNPGGSNRPGNTSEGGGGAGESGQSGGAYGGKGGAGVQIASAGFSGSKIGIPSLEPYSGYFGGGGDGNSSTNATRPLGGGGAMPSTSNIIDAPGQNGIDYLGGGASGPGSSGSVVAVTGGKGIVVIRYLV